MHACAKYYNMALGRLSMNDGKGGSSILASDKLGRSADTVGMRGEVLSNMYNDIGRYSLSNCTYRGKPDRLGEGEAGGGWGGWGRSEGWKKVVNDIVA